MYEVEILKLKNRMEALPFHSSERDVKKLDEGVYDAVMKYSKDHGLDAASFMEKKYVFVNQMGGEIPVCKECEGEVKFVSTTKGYQKFCSHECLSKWQMKDEEFKTSTQESRSLGMKKKRDERYSFLKREVTYERGEGKMRIHEYCKHGDLLLYAKTIDKVTARFRDCVGTDALMLCDECRKDYVRAHEETINDRESDLKSLSEFSKPSKENLSVRDPHLLVDILIYTKKLEGVSWTDRVYAFRNGITEQNKCENCGKAMINIRDRFCSSKCRGEKLKREGHFSRIMSEYHDTNNKMLYAKKFKKLNFSVERDGYQYIIKEYCEHGDVSITLPTLNKAYSMRGEKLNVEKHHLCERCKERYLNENDVDDVDEGLKDEFIAGYRGSKPCFVEPWVRQHYVEVYRDITRFRNDRGGMSWSEALYLYTRKMERPKCQLDGCDNDVEFNSSGGRPMMYCSEHKHSFTSSKGEREVAEFVSSLGFDCVSNDRKMLGRKELDVYVPSLRIGIEFNGTHWHSDESKSDMYHYEKWKLCQERGIRLFTVWEEDWDKRQEIVKSMISRLLGASCRVIDASECEVVEASDEAMTEFLTKNHLYGPVNGSVSLGMYHDGSLVSVMSFDRVKEVGNVWEIVCFCNALNVTVDAGLESLWNKFLEDHSPSEVIYHANLDAEDGEVLRSLGFVGSNKIEKCVRRFDDVSVHSAGIVTLSAKQIYK